MYVEFVFISEPKSNFMNVFVVGMKISHIHTYVYVCVYMLYIGPAPVPTMF